MRWDTVCDSLCPVARSLAVVGDRWTLLILRELALGTHRFDEIQAQTGMSSHLLATRLKRLEQDGVIEKRHYSERPLRYEYHATAKGKELAPVLLALQAWGLKWGGYGPEHGFAAPPARKRAAKSVTTQEVAATGSTAMPEDSVRNIPKPLAQAMRTEREAKRRSFQADKSAARSVQAA